MSVGECLSGDSLHDLGNIPWGNVSVAIHYKPVPPSLFPDISDSEDNADDSDGVADDMEEEEEPEANRIAHMIDGAFWAGVEGRQGKGSVKEQIGVQAAREFAQGEIVEDGKRVHYSEGRRVEIETFRGAGWPYDATLDRYLPSALHLLR
jgi:hypothetical protein